MYLIAADQQTIFTFDLATRQWLSAATPVLSSPSVEPPEVASPTIEAWPTLMTAAQIEATAQVAGTALAHHAEAILTSVAHSTWPPRPTYGPYTETPEPPIATWAAGLVDCGGPPESQHHPEFVSCWQSALNGQLLWLFAGHEQASYGDPEQGVLQVGLCDLNQNILGYDTYRTPQKVGPIRITTLDGMRVSLITVDPQRTPVAFTFDLATRQWLPAATTPAPSPVPSLLPTP